jgi:N-methylhydantoinase A/oxoprolinase/acetone carboxylase beta subunit
MASPFDAERVNRNLERLEEAARRQMAKDGIAEARQSLQFSVDMRHKGQINEVEVVLDWKRAEGAFEAPLRESFYQTYERLYGRGASFHGARVEMVTFRVRAMAETPRPRLVAAETLTEEILPSARRTARTIYWDEEKRSLDTPVYDGTALRPGNAVAGPAVFETPDTTVVVRPGQSLRVDAFGNFEIILRA